MSRSLIKFVDLSLFPAAMMVLGKLLGVFFLIRILDLKAEYSDFPSNFLSFAPAVSSQNIAKVASYSDLLMYCIIVGIFSFSLVKSIFLHSTHVKPTLVSRLANKNLLKLIQSSYEIYHAAAVNLLFLWISTIIIAANALSGKTFIWIGLLSFISTIVLTTILLHDIYREVDNIKHRPGDYNWN